MTGWLPSHANCVVSPCPSASVVFMSKLVPPKRKALTVYPVLLFYLFISWMVLIQ